MLIETCDLVDVPRTQAEVHTTLFVSFTGLGLVTKVLLSVSEELAYVDH